MKKEIKEILKIAEEFLQIPSTTGYEFPFLNYLNKKIKGLGYNTILKNNYLVVSNSNPENLFSVHIDRQGLILNENEKLEYGAFYNKKKIGEKFRREEIGDEEKELICNLNKNFNTSKFSLIPDYLKILGENNQVFLFQLPGNSHFFEKVALRYIRESVSSYNSETGEILNNFKTTRYDLDIEKQEISFELDKKLSKKDKVFMLNSKISFNEKKFSGQIDNVISAAVLFYLLKTTNFKDEIIFTTGEEYGNSWNCVVDYIKDENKSKLKLIILDTSPYPNLEVFSEGFITLRYGDERFGFNLELVNKIKKILENEKIKFDFKPSYIGRTELGKISLETKGKINGTTLQIPTINYHTTFETATIKSLENYLKICEIISK